MTKLRLGLATLVAIAAAVAMSASASAAPTKGGCGNAQSGWMLGSIDAIAATIWDGLVDQSPWGTLDVFEMEVATADHNDDGSLCLKIGWSDLNPNSHWYPYESFTVLDNNANGSNH